MTKNNPEFFNQMIQTFISNAHTGIDQIRTACDKEDWKMIRETAHRLIPSFKHLDVRKGVLDLVEIKNRCEGKPDRQILSKLISRIGKETEEVLEMLRKESV
ncbi:MAG: Hpt domain-containing protein [Bacteroidetes bacterium]|nr:MAG: Hpt domain-containing protein [Bacteroidota bacterium]